LAKQKLSKTEKEEEYVDPELFEI